MKKKIINYLKKSYYRLKIKSNNVHIHRTASFDINSKFRGNNTIYNKCKIVNTDIGYGTYIAEGSKIYNCKIGKYCSIGPSVSSIIGIHPTSKFVSTHPSFYSVKKQAGFTFVKKNRFKENKILLDGKSIIIGNDVWIGANVLLLEGVTIGNGAIIAAGSIVNKDVSPYEVVGGIPAKKIKERFSKEQQELLLLDKWWDKDPEWLQNNYEVMGNIDSYVETVRN